MDKVIYANHNQSGEGKKNCVKLEEVDQICVSNHGKITEEKCPQLLEDSGDGHLTNDGTPTEAASASLQSMEQKSVNSIDLKVSESSNKEIPSQENKTYKCAHCESVFRQKNNLRRHLKLHSGHKPYVCKDCGLSFYVQDSLKKHMRTHTGEKPYKCEECNTSFAHSGHLKAHKRTHSGEKPYKCQECGLFFSQAGNLKVHMRVHTGEKPFVCKICGAAFAISSVFKKHKLVHTGERPFKCSYCDARFSSNSNLSRHNKTHTGERPFKCQLCDAAFPVKNSLDRHIKSHTGERPYCCEMCGAVFADMSDLTKHRKTHSSEKPLKCKECGKGFFSKSQMNIHIRTHTGEKPHKCQLCDAAFAQIGTLNKHKQRHSGKKPFQCDICFTQFTAKSSLKKHMERHSLNAMPSTPSSCNVSTYCGVNLESTPFHNIQNKVLDGNGICNQETLSLSTKLIAESSQAADTLSVGTLSLNSNNSVLNKRVVQGSSQSPLPSVPSSLHSVESTYIDLANYNSGLHTLGGHASESSSVLASYTALEERSSPISFPDLHDASELCDIGKNSAIVSTTVHNEVQYLHSFSEVVSVPSIQPGGNVNSLVPNFSPPHKW
ncbi:zinc finger protein 391-like [Penaeus japonicus]|uniref:zinc finger protein 391-like n=1 Tax=Penaeus japonicus TaxID=27405 RepID=UPI001C716242|nr:zinc finger protein 391-like [Penaeus japonicus]